MNFDLDELLTEYYDASVVFWDEVYNPKTEKDEIKFSYDMAGRFLMNNGFFKMAMQNKTYCFVRIKNNILEVVNERIMREFMLGFVSRTVGKDKSGKYTNEKDTNYMVREMFKKGAKTYGSTATFESIDYSPELNFKREERDTAYLYFRNGFLEINKHDYKLRPYSELDGYIWDKQIIQHDFVIDAKGSQDAVYRKFIQLAVAGGIETEDTIQPFADEISLERIASAQTAMGYLMHSHKDSANAKAVVTADRKLRHGGNESNGGNGKSMFFKAISKVIHTDMINGKMFRFDSSYPFETLSIDHQMVVFNDVKKNFDFEMLFHYVTEDWTFRRLYENAVTMPFETSPKIGVATNFTLKGQGSSFMRRQHILEFSNFFNEERDPIKVFGARFFNDWDTDEWNRFYNYMADCLCSYLEHGLLPFPSENYTINKFIDAAGEDVLDWMDENIGRDKTYELGAQHDKAAMFEHIKKDITRLMKHDRPNTFTQWVKNYCDINDLEINAHKQGERDKSGSKEYWTFTIKPLEI